MIEIFRGRSAELGGSRRDRIFITIDVVMRDYLWMFERSSLKVFMFIAFHTDRDGWANPTVAYMVEKLRMNRDTISVNLTFLRNMVIEGKRVMLSYQPVSVEGEFLGSKYLIFPSEEDVEKYEQLVHEQPGITEVIPRALQERLDQAARQKAMENSFEGMVARLAAEEAYLTINVREEALKAEQYYKVRSQKLTRIRLVNWLNRSLERGQIAAPDRSPAPSSREERERSQIDEPLDKLFHRRQ